MISSLSLSRIHIRPLLRTIRQLCVSVTSKLLVNKILVIEDLTSPSLVKTFNELQSDNVNIKTLLTREELHQMIKVKIQKFDLKANPQSSENIECMVTDLVGSSLTVTSDSFSAGVTRIAERIDPRVYGITGMFFLTGTSVGILIPCTPLLVHTLHIPPSQFGLIISVFGISKFLANFPAGYIIEHYGRKPIIIAGLVSCGVGLGGLGLTFMTGLGASWMICCRFLTGLGVTGFVSGATTYLTDISSRFNRTRSIAPPMAGFSSGMAIGPAIGGIMIDTIGLSPTFAVVGGLFLSISLLAQLLLKETGIPIITPTLVSTTKKFPGSAIIESVGESITSWKEIMKIHLVPEVIYLNTVYYMAISACNMTILPLFMIGPQLSLAPSDIGMSFAFMSIISVLAAQPVASLADRYGKMPLMFSSSALVSASILCIPCTTSHMQLLMVLAPLALGSTGLSAVPAAYIADLTSSKHRPQALSLLRAAGDLGMVVGAVTAGLLADLIGLSAVIEADGIMLCTGLLFIVSRRFLFSNNRVK
jgi:MFS family permease